MRTKLLLLLAVQVLLLSSCFREDEKVPPYVWKGHSFISPVSIYSNQVYYDLSDSAAFITPGDGWDLAFESARDGFHIFMNTGNLLGAAHTGVYDLSRTTFNLSSIQFLYDKSDGNPDSTAFGNWVSGRENPVYTREVYLVGKYDGAEYVPFIKIQFTGLSDTAYAFRFGPPNASSGFSDVVLTKDTLSTFTFFSFASGSVKTEPARENWDLVFTQYMTTLYTDDGIPTPYFVRGALLNPWKTEAALDTGTIFEGAFLGDTSRLTFSNARDIIGHDWKDVKVNTETNTAEYFVRPGYNYFIKDSQGNIFVLRFRGFYNDLLQPGYPSFEYNKLQ